MAPRLLTIDTQKRLAKLSVQVQDTARKIADQRMTLAEMSHLKTILDMHSANMQHLFEIELNRRYEDGMSEVSATDGESGRS